MKRLLTKTFYSLSALYSGTGLYSALNDKLYLDRIDAAIKSCDVHNKKIEQAPFTMQPKIVLNGTMQRQIVVYDTMSNNIELQPGRDKEIKLFITQTEKTKKSLAKAAKDQGIDLEIGKIPCSLFMYKSHNKLYELLNAANTGKTTLVFHSLFKILSYEQYKAVLAHEFGHQYHKHNLQLFILNILTKSMLLACAVTNYRNAFNNKSVYPFITLMLVTSYLQCLCRKYFEIQADRFAATLLKDDKMQLGHALDCLEQGANGFISEYISNINKHDFKSLPAVNYLDMFYIILKQLLNLNTHPSTDFRKTYISNCAPLYTKARQTTPATSQERTTVYSNRGNKFSRPE